MKKILLLFIFFISLSTHVFCQDIPLYSQKLTNSFLYNPAVAGNTFGSVTYAYQQGYNHIPNAPQSNFLSVHAPWKKHKFGVGVNLYQEDVNFLRSTYASAAFAYHIRFNRTNVFSMGVAGEYNMLRLSGNTNSTAEDPEYQNLVNAKLNDADFSMGIMYQTKFLKLGLSGNRLGTAWLKRDNKQVLSSYYTAFVQGMIPVRSGNDVLEPSLTYRNFSGTNTSLDVGLYYTYNNRLTAGAALRTGGVMCFTAGVRVAPKILIGYSHEIFLGDVNKQMGSTSQFTLRFDFNEYSYKNKFREDYKASLAYRRKTLTKIVVGSKSPREFHKKEKRRKFMTPNKRYHGVKRYKHLGTNHGITPKSQQIKRKFRRR